MFCSTLPSRALNETSPMTSCRTDPSVVVLCHADQGKSDYLRMIAPCTLSFSISRYPSSTFGEYIREARLEKWLR